NQLPQAEAEFEKVVKLAPDQAVGYADLGLVYLREGRYREAEAQLRRAATLDSADNNIGLMLAKVYELTGREPEARREVERVLRRDSTDIRALYAAAELAGRSPDPEERRRQESYLGQVVTRAPANIDRKSTRLNSSHVSISYAVFCLKKKKNLQPAGTSSEVSRQELNPRVRCK